jgi:hypothetical protein
MSDRSGELLFAWLNQRVERLTAFSACPAPEYLPTRPPDGIMR